MLMLCSVCSYAYFIILKQHVKNQSFDKSSVTFCLIYLYIYIYSNVKILKAAEMRFQSHTPVLVDMTFTLTTLFNGNSL